MTVRVLVVDDHPIVRGGLVALLQGQPDVEVVGEASNAAEAISRADDTLRHTASGPAVVILTTYDHDVDIVRAVEAGAAGYLLKDADPQAIIAAIRTAAAGGIVLDESQERRVVESMRVRRVDLSGREREVLALVADGLSNREIAKALFLSEATVKTHLVHAFDKLGVDSRTAAVAAARAAGVID